MSAAKTIEKSKPPSTPIQAPLGYQCLWPVFYDELSPDSKLAFQNRKDFGATLQDYILIDPESGGEPCRRIPPIVGSIALLGDRDDGCAYPWIFMSTDKAWAEGFLEDPHAVRDGCFRVIEVTKGAPDIFFIGFDDIADVEFFLWGFAYDPAIKGDVFLNGHPVLCGEALLDAYI